VVHQDLRERQKTVPEPAQTGSEAKERNKV